MHDPTDRQVEVLKFVDKFKRENLDTPTMGEIGEVFGITKRAVQDHLKALQKKGMIEMIPYRNRIKILNREWIDG